MLSHTHNKQYLGREQIKSMAEETIILDSRESSTITYINLGFP